MTFKILAILSKLNKKKFSSNFYYFLFSLIITTFGLFIYEQRFLDSNFLLQSLGIDERNYIKLTVGQYVPDQIHACRILLPLLASFIPIEAVKAIYLINVISFFLLIFSICKMLEIFSKSKNVIIFTVLQLLFTFSVAYNFTNPYLTDLPGMLTLILFVISIMKSRFYSSLFWIAISLFFRETAIVLAPLFFLIFSTKKNIVASVVILSVYIVPKLLIAGDINCGFNRPFYFGSLLEFKFIAKIFLSYSSLWYVGLIGFLSVKEHNAHLSKLVIATLILICLGSFFSSLKSYTDVTRMNFLMFPILSLGFLFFIKKIYDCKYVFVYLSVLLISTFVLSLGFLPNIFIKGNFNSLQEFAESNVIFIAVIIVIQNVVSIILVGKFLKKFKVD